METGEWFEDLSRQTYLLGQFSACRLEGRFTRHIPHSGRNLDQLLTTRRSVLTNQNHRSPALRVEKDWYHRYRAGRTDDVALEHLAVG
jgi:hypothetical protein